jgi:hypothetical protein
VILPDYITCPNSIILLYKNNEKSVFDKCVIDGYMTSGRMDLKSIHYKIIKDRDITYILIQSEVDC